jgi:hypothetical protein
MWPTNSPFRQTSRPHRSTSAHNSEPGAAEPSHRTQGTPVGFARVEANRPIPCYAAPSASHASPAESAPPHILHRHCDCKNASVVRFCQLRRARSIAASVSASHCILDGSDVHPSAPTWPTFRSARAPARASMRLWRPSLWFRRMASMLMLDTRGAFTVLPSRYR